MSRWRINMLGPFEVLNDDARPLDTGLGKCAEILALQAFYFCDPELGLSRLQRLRLGAIDGSRSDRRLAAFILYGAAKQEYLNRIDQTCRLLRGRGDATKPTRNNPFGPIMNDTRGLHGLNPGLVETDVDLFERAVTRSQVAASASDDRLRSLWEAVQLYRGQFLDHLGFLDWLKEPREQYSELYATALANLADYLEDPELRSRCLDLAERRSPLSLGPTSERIRAVVETRLGSTASVWAISRVADTPAGPRYDASLPDLDDAFVLSVLKPDACAEEMAARSRVVVGNMIECYAHSSLQNTSLSLAEIGWATNQVHLLDLQEEFDAGPFMTAARPPTHPRSLPPNNIKLMLVGIPGGSNLDGEKELWLELKRTSFYDVNNTANYIPDHPEIRKEFGRLDPEESQIPHSINLEHIARLNDGHLLCWFRKGTAVHDRVYGITGEEQLKPDEDFGPPDTMTRWMRRTYLEEVLPLKGGNYDERWKTYGEPTLNSMRIWTIFLEEANWNFDLLGIYDMKLSLAEFVDESTRIRLAETSQWDREGDPYVISRDQALRLLAIGECTAFDPFVGALNSEVTITEDRLHRSSRYRLFHLMRALYRGDLMPELKRIRARSGINGPS